MWIKNNLLLGKTRKATMTAMNLARNNKCIMVLEMILITSPHGYGSASLIRTHDMIAHSAAKELSRCIKNGYYLMLADTPRAEIDLNRKVSRTRKWRKLLTAKIKSNDYSLLLDVHSFPAYEEKWEGNEVVIMDIEPYEEWVSDLHNYLNKKDIAAIRVVGSSENDIILQAKRAGLYAIILEFNEDLCYKRLLYITNILCDYFNFIKHT